MFKDFASNALARILRPFFNDVGRLERLDVDRKQKSITVAFIPLGEQSLLTVTASGVSVQIFDGRHWLTWQNLRIDRPWMQSLFNRVMKENRVPIPANAAKLISLVLG